jgi:hypothetical protein
LFKDKFNCPFFNNLFFNFKFFKFEFNKMGQYYQAVILTKVGDKFRIVLRYSFVMFAKLLEHSYINNGAVQVFEYQLSPFGLFHQSHVVWAGDYADKEPGQQANLYAMDAASNQEDVLHPLPLLTAEGNGRGGGDFRGDDPQNLVGSWARDLISVEAALTPEQLNEYTELVFNLTE